MDSNVSASGSYNRLTVRIKIKPQIDPVDQHLICRQAFHGKFAPVNGILLVGDIHVQGGLLPESQITSVFQQRQVGAEICIEDHAEGVHRADRRIERAIIFMSR